jgi:hypothetical protein
VAAYTVQHAYSSFRDGQPFGPWVEGDTVDVESGDADWVNRDSPGCLKSVAPAKERASKPDPNRQHRGSANRSVR